MRILGEQFQSIMVLGSFVCNSVRFFFLIEWIWELLQGCFLNIEFVDIITTYYDGRVFQDLKIMFNVTYSKYHCSGNS